MYGDQREPQMAAGNIMRQHLTCAICASSSEIGQRLGLEGLRATRAPSGRESPAAERAPQWPGN